MRDRADLSAFDHSEEDPTTRSSAAEEIAVEWEALEETQEIMRLPDGY